MDFHDFPTHSSSVAEHLRSAQALRGPTPRCGPPRTPRLPRFSPRPKETYALDLLRFLAPASDAARRRGKAAAGGKAHESTHVRLAIAPTLLLAGVW